MPNLDRYVVLLFWGLMIATCVSKCPRIRKIKNLRPKYQSQRRIVYFRCKRGYDLIGANSAVCNDDKWSAEYPICIAPGCPLLDYDKNVLDVTYTYRGSLATFQCKTGYVMEDEDNRVYCNKIDWNKPVPICAKEALKKTCDYEDGLCGWTQAKDEQFDWEIHSKGTSTRFTGPSNDHTYGNMTDGHYIYVESSAPRRQGDKARLVSPLYNFKMRPVCFEFWFHMWCSSQGVGSLQIYAIPGNRLWTSFAPLKTLTGNYGDSWNRERIQIDPMQDSFRIILEATRGLNHQNDIGIDDIRLWEGLCNEPPKPMDPLISSTDITFKAEKFSTAPGQKSVVTVNMGKETIPTTLLMQSSPITSPKNLPVSQIMTDKEIEPITIQPISNKMLVTEMSSSKEMKPTERRRASITNVNISEKTTEFVSQKIMVTASVASVTLSEAGEQNNNISHGFTFEQSSKTSIEGKILANSSEDDSQDYTPLAIGITVALLFGISVIFFIVWVWARSQDRKRAMAEDEEETQPITNAGSTGSLQNNGL